MISILDIHTTKEIAGNDVEGRGCAVGFAFRMIADTADETLAFHLNVDRRGYEELYAAEERVDVDFLILCNGRFAQVQADASAESIEPGTMKRLTMIDVFVSSIMHRATDALAVLADWQWPPQPLIGVSTIAVDNEMYSYI